MIRRRRRRKIGSLRTLVFMFQNNSPSFAMLVNLRKFKLKKKGFRIDDKLHEFFESEGIQHETSSPYTPQQTGLDEREIGYLMDKSRTLMVQDFFLNIYGGFNKNYCTFNQPTTN